MLNIAICDDIAEHAAYTARLIQAHPACTDAARRVFSAPQALLTALAEGYAPDIAVLDIQMDGMDGIALAKSVNAAAPACCIIFLSAYLDYAPQVYAAEHVYFVLKSQIQEHLGAALDKCVARLQTAPACILIHDGVGFRRVRTADIRYMERVLHRTRIALLSEELWTNAAPKELLAPLEAHSFLQSHQSYYVNMEQAEMLLKDTLILKDGTRIPVSRAHRKAAREAFLFRGK